MRTRSLLFALALSLASVSILPGADAMTRVCTSATTGSACGGYVCADQNGDGAWSDAECVSKSDVDRCEFHTDCCDTTTFWCPDRA